MDNICQKPDASTISQSQLSDLLAQVMGSYRDVYITIDAIDELERDTQDELLKSLWPMENASLLITSRPSVEPPAGLSPQREITRMSIGDQNRHDINLFVHHTLKNTGKFVDILGGANPIEEVIVNKIDAKASGM
jgi:hypothetical protein